MDIKLSMIQTLALAIVCYYLGLFTKRKISILDKFCIPSPVIGGLIFAIINFALRQFNIVIISLDVTLQDPFMLVFFTTIGLGASLSILKKGGKAVLLFSLCAVGLVVLQDIVGISLAKLIGANPLMGLIAGSVTMTGGHATGATWGKLFEANYGFVGASATAVAAATFGLIGGSIIGGPIARKLIQKNNLKTNSEEFKEVDVNEGHHRDKINYKSIFDTMSVIFICMGLGSVLQIVVSKLGIVLPSYIYPMLVASVVVNIGEGTKKYKINEKCVDLLGNIGLNVFLSMALMNLKLWELKDTAGPLMIILIGQTLLMAMFSYFVTFRVMGKDYDAAVISAGHCGFGMGATPNGMANMDAITTKYGPSPKAFFVLPVVGAFLVDFLNSTIIGVLANILTK
ncbi:glutamate:Na+ symporter, ESS family [Hathewaya proteolytica DSM 3090]|uniref:Sodium/glutamate symporter n=1 Tax=Hathewaya proteolytica DSM 3090 TaxID=1121331 RepID=A0A1M6N999_9CLOT|nr:sodium/glutamate symporter [Hathewaya proteolytica]SHJ92279.1 glutamate:Na+ symporter, ESS family [Hathewaya proteolytica DSM 3090]